MKKSELTRIIKEEIQKVLNEKSGEFVGIQIPVTILVDDPVKLAGPRAQLKRAIGDQTEDQPQIGNKLFKTILQNVQVVVVDLDEATNPDAKIDGMIKTSTPITKLATINKQWARDWAGKGYKYFSFIPYDYNRGTNRINLGVSKVPDVLETIVGDYDIDYN
jgi:hypothetical protein